jgi:hypothetical protein
MSRYQYPKVCIIILRRDILGRKSAGIWDEVRLLRSERLRQLCTEWYLS